MTIGEDEKLTTRVEKASAYFDEAYNLGGQLDWYDRKATMHKTWHMRLGMIIIASGAMTSVVQLWAPSPEGVHWSAWLTALLGAIVIIAKGIDSIWKFDENWTNYRQAAESLKRERRLYVNASGPYASSSEEEARFELFIQRVEEIMAAEGQSFWKQNTQNAEEDK